MAGFLRLGVLAALLAALHGPIVVAQEAPQPQATPPAGSVAGLGDINLYPKRLVLTDRDRLGTIGLYNRSPSTGEYEITISDKLMLPSGSIVDMSDDAARNPPSGFRPASTLLRYSPKSVQLPGNESQTVRIVPRLPADLPPGEYRAHFTVSAVPPITEADSISAAVNGNAQAGIGVQILPRFGISIPVILRIGATTLDAGISEARFFHTPEGSWEFEVTLTRTGTRSAFGDVMVTAAGFASPVAQLRGVGLYTEINSRTVRIPMDPKVEREKLRPGMMVTITYLDDDVAPGAVLARKEIRLP